jgi:hypothetical protein
MGRLASQLVLVAAVLLSARCVLPEVQASRSDVPVATVEGSATAVDAGSADVVMPSVDAGAPITTITGNVDQPCIGDDACSATLVCHKGLCKRDLNEACVADEECAIEACYHVCRSPLPAGGACDSAPDCVAPSSCMVDRCLVQLGDSCVQDGDCETGTCNGGRCTTPRNRLGACNSDADCAAGLVCLQFRSADADRYCEQKGGFPLDASCEVDSDCGQGSCG